MESCRSRFAVMLAVVAGTSPVVAAPPSPLPPQPAGVPWPTKEWPTGPLPSSVSVPALEEMLRVVQARRPLLGQTRAVVIVQGGRLVLERYMPGFGPDMPLISWSMAKSITQALVGVAVRDGRLEIDKPMGNPRWAAGDPRAAVTWRQWMNMVDGQEYREIGEDNPTKNDAARMLYGEGRLDVCAFSASLPLIHTPGTHWNYNSAGINLISDALGRLYAPGAAPADRRTRMADMMFGELFRPLGMASVTAEFDATGTFIGSALVYATARDYARFGLLYLRDGVWEGRQLLPRGWVDFARTTAAKNGTTYGAGWWVTPEQDASKPAPGGFAGKSAAATDHFRAQGHEGQLIVVVPSKDLVVVRLGLLEGLKGWEALGDWMEKLVALF
ncbi:MAG TPA: serine hydrolase [Polyangia bacterium]|jgi:CubicO group peptidase (beta-lactamase class C family)|nr:serine hydrolase [Polyangia bacterium]